MTKIILNVNCLLQSQVFAIFMTDFSPRESILLCTLENLEQNKKNNSKFDYMSETFR